MKTLTNFINEELFSANVNIFESYEEFETLQDVYEELGYKMLRDEQICEGLGSWLRKLADKGDKIDAKAQELKDAAKERIKKMSDSAKNALETVKKKAGNAWEKIKDTYTSVLSTVDTALQNSKDAINGLAKTAGQKISNVETTIATVFTNAIAAGGEFGKKVVEWAADKTHGLAITGAVSTFMVASLLAAKAGVNYSLLTEILDMAGIKK